MPPHAKDREAAVQGRIAAKLRQDVDMFISFITALGRSAQFFEC